MRCITRKTCSHCKTLKDISGFQFNKTKNRFESWCKDCVKKQNAIYRENHRELCRKQAKIHHQKNKDKRNKAAREYYVENKEKLKPLKREYARRKQAILKEEVFACYGGAICSCCAETELLFLTIDHIKGDGAQHRKNVSGNNIYQWLKKNDYPKGFQVLCLNCNRGKWLNNGICPHKTRIMDGSKVLKQIGL